MPPPQCASAVQPRSHVHVPAATRPPSHAVVALSAAIAVLTAAKSSWEATTARRPLESPQAARPVNQLRVALLPESCRATKPWIGGDGGGGDGGGGLGGGGNGGGVGGGDGEDGPHSAFDKATARSLLHTPSENE